MTINRQYVSEEVKKAVVKAVNELWREIGACTFREIATRIERSPQTVHVAVKELAACAKPKITYRPGVARSIRPVQKAKRSTKHSH